MTNDTLEARFNAAIKKIRQEGVHVRRNLSQAQADAWLADKDVALLHEYSESGNIITFWRGLPYHQESIDIRERRARRRPYFGTETIDKEYFHTHSIYDEGFNKELYDKVLQIFSNFGIVVEWPHFNNVIVIDFAQSSDQARRAA